MYKRRNIIITGFMGTGKTTVGREVARRLGMGFYDTDEMVESRSRMSIARIFDRFGESGFREREREVFSELVGGMTGVVISTGGGTLLDCRVDNRLLASSMLVCLYARLEVLRDRIGPAPSRPLAGNVDDFGRLLKSREEKYRAIPNQIDTSNLAPGQVADEIIRIYGGQTA